MHANIFQLQRQILAYIYNERKLQCSSIGKFNAGVDGGKGRKGRGSMIKAPVVNAAVDYRNGICIRFRAQQRLERLRKILGEIHLLS